MVEKMNGLSREFIIHPGETLKEALENKGMTQRELALRTGVKEPHISGIVNCRKPISASLAKKLEYALGIDASFWIALQANHDKELVDFEEFNQISSQEIGIAHTLGEIVKYAKALDLLECPAQDSALVIELRRLLNVSNLAHIVELSQVGAYRLATSANVDPVILFAWLRICDLITKTQIIDSVLDTVTLRQKLPLLRSLAFEDGDTIRLKLKEYLAECGVRFAIVKHFTGAPVHGVITRRFDGTLNLVMTVRGKSADIFWFTLFHEIGHILNGDVAERLVDYEAVTNEAERRANEFATNVLIDPVMYRMFVETGDFALPCIRQFCTAQNIPTFILIGRLQRDKHLGAAGTLRHEGCN